MTTLAASTFYGRGFAEFYDRYGTGWTRDFTPVLAGWLDDRPAAGDRVALDLACGTGLAAQLLVQAGWDVVGIDISAGMLAKAAQRLSRQVNAGRVVLQQGDMTTFDLDRKVGACMALEGALNHLLSPLDLARCFARVAAVLRPGGTFVFDLYEPHHFRGWHHIALLDEPDAVVAKRGVWDEERAIGMLRISGLFEHEDGPLRVDQTVASRAYPAAVVHELLDSAGFRPGTFCQPVPDCGCGRSGSGLCRTIYAAHRIT